LISAQVLNVFYLALIRLCNWHSFDETVVAQTTGKVNVNSLRIIARQGKIKEKPTQSKMRGYKFTKTQMLLFPLYRWFWLYFWVIINSCWLRCPLLQRRSVRMWWSSVRRLGRAAATSPRSGEAKVRVYSTYKLFLKKGIVLFSKGAY